MDLFGPSRYVSLSGKYYAFVIVDDYSRYTCVLFLANTDDAFNAFKSFVKLFKMKKLCYFLVMSDQAGEFENHDFENFCNNFGH